MNVQLYALVMFLALIVISGGAAAYGMRTGKRAFVAVSLVAGIGGAVEIALLSDISMKAAGTAFAIVFGALGVLITVDGRHRHDKELFLQGLVQVFVAGAVLAYTQVSDVIHRVPEGRAIFILAAISLPWVILALVLLGFVTRDAREK